MSTTATVQVLLKIRVRDTWGDDCTIAQVKRQALESAGNVLDRAVERQPGIAVVGRVGLVDVHFGGENK